MEAAQVSYRFVRIHPYTDGNGRLSRLLMNLILMDRGHPPIAIKADSKKGRERYLKALRRANRNSNCTALACLIAQGLLDAYELLIDSLDIHN